MLMLCLIVVVVILMIVNRWKPNKLVKLHQKIGNDLSSLPIIGNAMHFKRNNEDRMKKVIQMSSHSFKRKHGALTLWIGPIFFVILSDIDEATVVLKSTLHKKFIHKFAKTLIGNGSVFAPVDIWHRRRKIIVPAFAPLYVNKFVAVFETHAKTIVEKLKSKAGKGNIISWDYMASYSLASICETVFGVKVDSQRQPDHQFFIAFKKFFENVAARVFKPWLHPDALYRLFPVYTRQEQMKKNIYEFLDDIICTKKALIMKEDGNGTCSSDPVHKHKLNFKTFLELMINNSQNTDKAYTNEELREETLVLLLAGTDTLSSAISTTILLLSQHSDVQERVYKEIQDVFGDSDKPLQLKDLLKLKYTKAVINETLRLYPPVPILNRYCEEDLELPSGIILPQGSNLVVNVWAIHRNPQHWGEDANDFNPDRFMSGQIPKAFIPFSNGPRNCIGTKYAMLSMTTTLVTLLRQYRFTPATNFTYDKNNPLRLSYNLTLKHVDNYAIQVENRNKI